ncbi:hypothetical protein SNL152K_10650 [Streptomyces sp. NL15-2K]|nr:hypothetical protein SNL152K_10650 [Streptomyces sp. NL15-2K]
MPVASQMAARCAAGEDSDSCGAGQEQPDRRQGDPASSTAQW